MKIQKLIGFDSEVYQKLSKTDNASALVNDLVRKHFANFCLGIKNPLELRINQLKNYSKSAKKLRKEAKILGKVYKMVDNSVVSWVLANQDNLGANNYNFHKYLLKRNIKVSYDQEDKIVEEIKNNVGLFKED
jgi:hypothetical protein